MNYRHGIKVADVHREYCCWRNMLHRCNVEKNKQYKDYGERGITVCEQWRNNFKQFLKDIGPRPPNPTGNRKTEYSIDRIDNSKGYFPGNCKWSTRSEQQRNRRATKSHCNSIMVMYQNEMKPLKEIGALLNLHKTTLFARYRKGDRGERLVRATSRTQ
jgi:hypothetical protein